MVIVTVGRVISTPDHYSFTTIRLLDALQTEFGEKICVILDNASYFTANKVQEFVEDMSSRTYFREYQIKPPSASVR